MGTQGKRAMFQYSEESLQSALNEIREGRISILGASKKYGVPRSTIQDRIHGRVAEGPRKMGPETVLSYAEEERIEKWCHDLAKCGFPIKIDDLLNTVQAIIKEDGRPTPFLNSRPGRKWYMSFLKRHPNLALRESEGISKGRAVITEEGIRKWFADLQSFLTEKNALDILEDPSRIFNGDETSFAMCPKTGKVLAPKGYRNVYTIQRGNEKETVTVLLVFSANGNTVVPMVVFPYIRTPKEVVNSLPDNWFLGKSESGWMVSETFFEYVANGVHNWLSENNIQRPILLFVDGHKSHMTLELSQFCDNNGIILYALPPNTTHIMQPADVSVFKPLKSEWKKNIREWQLKPENQKKAISKSTFCPILHMVLSNLNMTETIKNGFRKCGLYPFNADNVDYTKCVKNSLEKLIADNPKCEDSVKDIDLDIAVEVINKIALKLRERGINPDVVIEEISSLKTKDCQNIEILQNITIQSGTYVVNEEGILEKEKNEIPSTPTTASSSNLLSSSTQVVLTPTVKNNAELQSIYCLTPSSSRNYHRNNLVLLSTSSSPIPNNSHSNQTTLNGPSPTSAINGAHNQSRFTPIRFSPNTVGNLMKNEANSVSPTFDKHLYFPKLLASKQSTPKTKAPSAISALAWREHIQAKEKEKLDKAEAIQARKQERQKRKMEKRNKPTQVKKGRKQKQVCGTCDQDLDTDAEDDQLKNVGCDTCPKWFHLMCTELQNMAYEEVIIIDFVCKTCKEKTD